MFVFVSSDRFEREERDADPAGATGRRRPVAPERILYCLAAGLTVSILGQGSAWLIAGGPAMADRFVVAVTSAGGSVDATTLIAIAEYTAGLVRTLGWIVAMTAVASYWLGVLAGAGRLKGKVEPCDTEEPAT